MLSAPDPEAFERCMSVGGVAVFPADTVYGLACDPTNAVAVDRLYALKHRRRDKPSAVMFFDLEIALEALPELGPDTRVALSRLLPGGVTLLLSNPAGRYPLACGDDRVTLGLRIPVLDGFQRVRWPVLQSSANVADGPKARRLDEVPDSIRREADMVIDGGELPGTASTVIDMEASEAKALAMAPYFVSSPVGSSSTMAQARYTRARAASLRMAISASMKRSPCRSAMGPPKAWRCFM